MKIKQAIKTNFLVKEIRFLYIRIKTRSFENNAIRKSIEWRDINGHNFTTVGNKQGDCEFPTHLVKVGRGTYGTLTVASYGIGDEGLIIGDYCSIAPGVRFVLGGEHLMNRLSTFPFERIYVDCYSEELFLSKGKIIVENDVWIGSDALILSGVKLGQGTVVAAGSVVTKSTEPYSIIGGNPAKLIRKRFSEYTITRLLNIDFSKFDTDFIRSNIDALKCSICDINIDQFVDQLELENRNMQL